MRISFISPTVNLSGGIRVIVIYAQQLERLGHTVRIISPPPRKVRLRNKLKSWLRSEGWPKFSTRPRSHLDQSGVEHHVLDRWRPVNDDDVPDGDIVIATWWETAEWVKALSPTKGAKVYFIQHHEVFPYLPVDRCHATYRLPLHKIVVARWLKEVMSAQYGDNVVDLVPNSVDQAQFFAPLRGKQAVPTVGFVYSADPVKGFDILRAALGDLRERVRALRLISFGAERPMTELALPKGTEFFFSPPQDQIRNHYALCDVWVGSSRSEGFYLPAMEAMACRTPVVATRTGWPEEAIKTGWNGVLVNVEDWEGLARGIEWVLSRDEDEWKNLSSNAFATATSGSWESSARLFEKALEHACRRSKRGEIAGRCSDLPAG
jgi:glycosyltransferase involved in cell wall biosynthesis